MLHKTLIAALSGATLLLSAGASLAADVTLQIPAVVKFTKATGWKPQYSFEDSLADLLEYWRREARITAQRNAHASGW